MDLAEALISVPQKERGGEIAQRGFDYQTCWALSEMLKYELMGKEYVFIFEYHDDVLILDNEDNPRKVIFAQVKTREKHWTSTDLHSITKSKPISIIGKLYQQQGNFSDYSPELLFVTNALFSFHPKLGSKCFFNASSIEGKYQKKFIEKVCSQIKTSHIDLSILNFVQSSLSLEDHITHLKGKLCMFLDKKYGSEITFNANVLATLLESECRQKSKFSSESITSFDDLVKYKGFSSRAFNNVIDSIKTTNVLKPSWDGAKDFFKKLNRSHMQLITLEATFSQVCIALNKNVMNPFSEYLKNADLQYDKSKVEIGLGDYLFQTISSIDNLCPDYAMALTTGKKECIVIYSIIQKLIQEGEK